MFHAIEIDAFPGQDATNFTLPRHTPACRCGANEPVHLRNGSIELIHDDSVQVARQRSNLEQIRLEDVSKCLSLLLIKDLHRVSPFISSFGSADRNLVFSGLGGLPLEKMGKRSSASSASSAEAIIVALSVSSMLTIPMRSSRLDRQHRQQDRQHAATFDSVF